MPCRSDYLEPTGKERRLQETAQLLIYLRQNTNTGVKISNKLKLAARDPYCSADYVPELCEAIRSLRSEDFDRVVYNARDPISRKLADWWEEHEEADRQRVEAETKKLREDAIRHKAISKLTDEERIILGL
jgi:hypothetical protein